jgi:gliding motility-associated-like protein
MMWALLLLLFSGTAVAQPLPCPPTNTTFLTAIGDTTICSGNCVPLNVTANTTLKSTTEYTVTSIPYLPTTYCGGTPILVGIDDIYSQVLQLPFDFCFFGTKYNQCLIGANGQICFDISLAGAYNPWPISGGIPGNANEGTLNCIMGAYYDIDPSLGGNIRYATYGTAPCRTFVVSWDHIPLFNTSNCPGLISTQQIVLYETTYAIDVFIETRPICTNWNSGNGILGIMNADGSAWAAVPGYNGGAWSANNEGWRFTPDGDPSWTFTVYDSSGAVVATQSAADSFLVATLSVCPDFSERYTVRGVASSNCDSIIKLDTVRVKVGWQPQIDSAEAYDVSGCGMFDGRINLWGGLLPNDTFIIHYYKDGLPQANVVTIADIDSMVAITGLGSGNYSNIYITTTLGCISDTVGPFVIEDPTPVISNVTTTPPSLCRAADATLTIEGLIADSTYTVTYSVGGITYTVTTAANSSGQITLTGLLAGSYTLTVTLLTCTSAPYGPVTIANPPITADFIHQLFPGCLEDTVAFTDISSGSAYPFEYLWQFGDSTTASTEMNPVHIYEDQDTYPVTLIITDSVCRDTIVHDVVIDHPLVANFTTDKDTICQNESITFTDASTATGPVTYTWYYGTGDTSTFNSNTQTYTYLRSGTLLTALVISDFINCKDTAYKYVRVDSLTEILISFDSIICAGEEIKLSASYEDTGSTGVTWDFADGIVTTTFGHYVEHAYENPGVYMIHVIATARVCPDVDSARLLTVQPQPTINLGPDTSMCPTAGPLVLQDLENAGNPAASWKWMLWDKWLDETTFNITANEPGRYTSVVTIGECSATDSVWVQKDCYIDVPNAFSPNGDNMNDHFIPRQWLSRGVTSFKMLIFNRWGQEIFSTTNINGRGWDGKFNDVDQPQGVYVYVIDVTFKDGRSEHKQGNVTLMR